MDFLDLLEEKLKVVEWGPEIMRRAVNAGFSGGEKKRNEILQMAVLEPQLAILDETDSGLDIDALRIVADGVNTLRRPDTPIIVVTHYQRLLNYIVPDFVHVLVRRPDREVGRQGAGARARGAGLRVARGRGRRREPAHDRTIRRAAIGTDAGPGLAGTAAPGGRCALRRVGVPDVAGRGVALHADRADRPGELSAGAARGHRSRSRPTRAFHLRARRRGRGWSSSTARTARSCRSVRRSPAGVAGWRAWPTRSRRRSRAARASISASMPPVDATPFTALNTALHQDGAFVHVPARAST